MYVKIQNTIDYLTEFLHLNAPAKERQIALFVINLCKNINISNIHLGFQIQIEPNDSKITYAKLFDFDINSGYVNPDFLVILDSLFKERDYNIVFDRCISTENLHQYGVLLNPSFSYIVDLSLGGNSFNQSSKIISINRQNSFIVDSDLYNMDFDFYISSDLLSFKSSFLFDYNRPYVNSSQRNKIGLDIDKQQIYELSKDVRTFNHLLYVIKTNPDLLTRF